MEVSNSKGGSFDLKIIFIDLVIFLCDILLSARFFGSNGAGDFVLNGTALALALIFSALLVRGLRECTHEHSQIKVLKENIASAQVRLAQIKQQTAALSVDLSEKLLTPFQVIYGYSSMLLDGTFGLLGTEVRAVAERIFRTSSELSVLIEGLISALAKQNSSTLGSISETVHEIKNDLSRSKIFALRFLTVVTTLVLVWQIFLANSVYNLLASTSITILVIIGGLFLVSESKHEPQSENTVGDMTGDLDVILKEIAILENKKSEFLSLVSKSLHAPIVSIMDDALHLSQGEFEEISADAKEAAGKIFESSDRLIVTLSDLVGTLNAPAK